MRSFRRLALIVFLLLFSGLTLAADLLPSQRSRSLAAGCTGCHGTSGQGYASFPAINRYSAAEITRLLREFRGESRRATVMNRIAKGYSDEEVAILATYFSHR